MIIAPLSANAASRGYPIGGCVVDCNGAQLRAHARDQAAVVQVTGDIDATNIDRFYDYVSRFVGEAPSLILDLSDVNFLCAEGISVLTALGEDCRIAGTRWAIISSPFVRRVMRLGDFGAALHIAGAQCQAVDYVAPQREAVLVAS